MAGARGVVLVGVVAVLTIGSLGFLTSAGAATTSQTQWTVTIDGRPIATADANHPEVLRPAAGARVVVQVTNNGTGVLEARSVRLEGDVVGLTFFSYITRVDMIVPAGATSQRAFDLDLSDLTGQAVGLIPGRVELLGAQGRVLVSSQVPFDVKGSLWSVYGVFGLAVVGITVLLLVGLLRLIATGSLPENRWRRGLRFLAAGLGIGLTLTFTLSATRLLLPDATASGLLVLGCGAGAFLLGYFSPTSLGQTGRDEPADDVDLTSEPEPAARTIALPRHAVGPAPVLAATNDPTTGQPLGDEVP